MRIGKLTNKQLKEAVLDILPGLRKEVTLRPGVGIDCAALKLDGQAVLSTDPITAGGGEAGRLAVHVCANDVAAAGAEPVGMLLTVLVPPTATLQQIHAVVSDAAQAARQLNIEIMGGHTEVTDAVNRILLSATVVGKAGKRGVLSAAGGKPGMDVVMTGTLATEGTLILCREKARKLRLTPEEKEVAEHLAQKLSIVKEGLAAAENGACAMHDVTEGGLYGAAYEMAEASGCGLELWPKRVPVLPLTLRVARTLNIDPYRLIGSGSLIIACPDGEAMVRALARIGCSAAHVGKLLNEGYYLRDGETRTPLFAPGADELYRALEG